MVLGSRAFSPALGGDPGWTLPVNSAGANALVRPKNPSQFMDQWLSSTPSHALSQPTKSSLENLRQENNWELFFGDLLHLADELRWKGSVQEAELLFQGVVAGEQAGVLDQPQMAERARSWIQVLRGGGSCIRRLEYQGRQFLDGVTEPISLASMAAGNLTFGTIRLFTYSHLLRAGALRGWAAHSAALSTAFAGEVGAFVGAGRVLRASLGEPLQGLTLGHEMASAAMMLGFLKAGGGLVRGILGTQALRPTGNFFQQVPYRALPQLGMLGGIMLAHGAEEGLGWKQSSSWDSFLTDSLVTLLQFNAMGKVMESALGSPYARLQGDLHRRTEALRQNLSRLPRGPLLPRSLAWVGVPQEGRTGSEGRHPWILQMSGKDGEGDGRDGKETKDLSRAPTLDASEVGDKLRPGREMTKLGPVAKLPAPPKAPDPEEFPSPPATGEEFQFTPDRGRERISSTPPPPETVEFEIRPGMQLGHERYTVLRLLGEGGMGQVWLLHDHSVDRDVVVKLPHKSLREYMLPRFEAEYRMQAHLPREWRVDFFEELELSEGMRVPVMEYVPGRDLYYWVSLIRSQPTFAAEQLPLQERIRIFAQICEAIQANHDMGIVHRDLKPENIRITDNYGVRIMDYGIAKHIGELESPHTMRSLPPEVTARMAREGTDPNFVQGTPGYIGPEWYFPPARRDGARDMRDPRKNDIFSLGVILYETMSGYHPFARYREVQEDGKITRFELVYGEDRRSIVDQRRTLQVFEEEFPPKFSQVAPWTRDNPVYEELDTIARRAFHPDPDQRFSSAEELRRAILMAQPRVARAEINKIYGSFKGLELDLQESEPAFRNQGRQNPMEAQDLVKTEVESRYLRDRWFRAGNRLAEGLIILMGDKPFPEAQQMLAEMVWDQLVESGTRIHEANRRDLIHRIAANDVIPQGERGLVLKRSLLEKVPFRFNFRAFGEEALAPVWVQIISLESEKDAHGFETGNFVEGETLNFDEVRETSWETDLPAGFYLIKLESPGFRSMNVPVRIRPEQVRDHIEGKSSLEKTFQLVPEHLVPEGGQVIHPTTGVIGHNWYVDGDVVTANSFPMRPYEIKTPLVISEKPITVAQYREFIEDLLRENNEKNGNNGAEFRKRLAEITNYLPRTNIEPGARGRLGQAFNRAFQRQNYYWHLERSATMNPLKDSRASLVDPTSHPDPFGDPILPDQPITAINYEAAEAYLQWLSQRDGKPYRMPTVEEMDLISRNSFDWRFPWGNGPLMPNYVVSRGAFANPDDVSPQPVGTHPLGHSRDRSLYNVVDLLGNTREFAAAPGLETHVIIFGGSVRMLFGTNFTPSARYIWHPKQVLDSAGSFRWVLDIKDPSTE